jgi:transcription-repair coupling factor (superfamily II helicase)
MFPDDFVNSITERLSLYTQLNSLKSEIELEVFERDLIDRFGALPLQVVDLLDSVRIKWLAITLGFEKIVLKQNKLIGYFISDQNSLFYQSDRFSKVLKYVQSNPKLCSVKEKQMRQGLRLLMSFPNVSSVQDGLKALKPILDMSLKKS